MVDTNNRESKKYNITDNEDMNNNYWINGLLTWWSGFSLRTKLLAIATLVVSILMSEIFKNVQQLMLPFKVLLLK